MAPKAKEWAMRTPFRFLFVASCGLAGSLALAANPVAVEYRHAGFGHYFVSASAQEIAALDAGAQSGWTRTGEVFGVHEPGTPGTADVCRFWSGSSFAPRSSHFYTPSAAECADVRAGTVWRYEGVAFAVTLPDGAGGCTVGKLPLYRLYNNARNDAPNHRYTTHAATRAQMLAQGWIAEGAGPGVVACVPPSGVAETISGHVVDGYIHGALVCLDANRNGRCDPAEPQDRSDAAGAYRLAIPEDSTAPLIAEMAAGACRDMDEPAAMIDASYRMATPSHDYGTDINPYSTLVYLTRLDDYRLAEDIVRTKLGLPPNFDLRLAAPPASGSLKRSVAKWIVRALQANGDALDLASPGALAQVVASFSIAITDLPQLAITTRNGAPIASKEVYVDATYVLTNPAASVPTVMLNGKIRGRGNTTWGQPKNPYKVQFANDTAYAAIGDVLGMKKQRNWALLADWFDRSLIRNKLALSLGASSVLNDGLKWTPSGQHLEVWLNGDYVGVYLLTEDIRIDPARLPLKKMGASDVDGGYIVEVDWRLDCYQSADLDMHIVTSRGVPICVDTPDEEAITPAQLAYVKQLIRDAESDLYDAGRIDRINPASFADWYLLQELFRNNDAQFHSSDFMWKDSASAADPRDRVLNMGPIWDFDRSAGNINYNGNWETEGCWVGKEYAPNWLSALLRRSDFLALTLSRWQQKRAALETFVNESVATFARRLAAPQHRNFQRWPILGVPLVNYYTFSSHDEEVGFVKRFLNERMAWLDRAYASPEAFDALCR
jgi:hypothetical protein